MSVPVHLRQESDFEVFNSWTKLDLQLTELMLGDFGYTVAKEQKRKQPVYDENMTDEKLGNYTARMTRNFELRQWFMESMRNEITKSCNTITSCIYRANSIYPLDETELDERRLLQEQAIGECYVILQHLQKAATVLPVKLQRYFDLAADIDKEISLLKGWRKSDGRFRRRIKQGTH